MAYQCPRCGTSVTRDWDTSGGGAGLFGLLLGAAVGSYECPQCGPLRWREFGWGPRIKIALTTSILFAASMAVLGGVLYLILRESMP